MRQVTFRKASERDIPLVLYFLSELAKQHLQTNLQDKPVVGYVANEQMIQEHLFDRPGFMEIVFAMQEGDEVGFAQYTKRFSFLQGHYTMNIQELFVLPAHRNKGVGKALFGYLIQYAQTQDCNVMEWKDDELYSNSSYYQVIGAQYKFHEKVFYLGVNQEKEQVERKHKLRVK
jgi:GNAT superfamily N-acetyltransferase